ncbi:MAG: PilZ domain-containing protein, partial [Terriglobia bacterium]
EELRGLRKGWGHSSWEAAVALAHEAGAKNLFLFHHDPARADNELDQIVQRARAAFPRTWAAAEYMAIDVARAVPAVSTRVARFSQRAPVNLPVAVEAVQEGARVRDDDAHLENISVQGAYFLTQQQYQLREPIDLDIALGADGPGGASLSGGAAFRLRGYVLRTEQQTTNGGWLGVAVRFPGKRIVSSSPPPRRPGRGSAPQE